MARKQKAESEASERFQARGNIRARIIDVESGFRLLSGVRSVRILNRMYNLLVMEDYMPVMGRIDGNVTFLTEDGEVAFRDIRGFYKHQHNEFTLLIDDGAMEAVEEGP